MFAGIHAQQGKIAPKSLEIAAQVTYRNGFTILEWVGKLFAEEQDLHGSDQEGRQS